MDLNSTNINSILGNLSCCIGSLGLQAIQDAKLGNDKCYKKHLKDIVLLDNIYKILKKGTFSQNTVYGNFQINPYKFPKSPLGIALYIDGELIAYGATDPNSDLIEDGLESIIYQVNSLGNGTSMSYIYIKASDDFEEDYYGVTYTSNSCEPIEVTLQLYTPYCDSPPIGCDYDPSLGTPEGDPINLDVITPGCCPEEFCYVSEDLETLYDMALKLCKICKNC